MPRKTNYKVHTGKWIAMINKFGTVINNIVKGIFQNELNRNGLRSGADLNTSDILKV